MSPIIPPTDVICLDPEDYDEAIMLLTGTQTLTEAHRALNMGISAWLVEQESKAKDPA
jgi:hypothetical protein